MSPTTRHYVISFIAGLLLAVVTILSEQFTLHPDGNIDWRLLGFSVLGGVILFARDWAKNNLGAFLEGVAPAVVQSGSVKPLDSPPPTFLSAPPMPPPPTPLPITPPQTTGPPS